MDASATRPNKARNLATVGGYLIPEEGKDIKGSSFMMDDNG